MEGSCNQSQVYPERFLKTRRDGLDSFAGLSAFGDLDMAIEQ
jgi:hypothetical protein